MSKASSAVYSAAVKAASWAAEAASQAAYYDDDHEMEAAAFRAAVFAEAARVKGEANG